MTQETTPRTLLLEDDADDARHIMELLREGYDDAGLRLEATLEAAHETPTPPDGDGLVHESTLEAGFSRLDTEAFDVVLLDLAFPDDGGLRTVRRLREYDETVPLVVLTDLQARTEGVEALRNGADEQLVKAELTPRLLVRSVLHAIERKARKRERRRYQTLIEESTDVNCILDADGSIQYLTRSVEHVLGYGQAEMVGVDVFEYLHPEDETKARKEFTRLIEDPEYRASAECRIRDADGEWVVLHARGRNLLADERIEGIVVYTHEISELKEYERRLEEQRERLAALNQLNGVVQSVTEAVLEQSTREEIEHVACERLASSSSYAFTWICERDSDAETVSVRAKTATDGYLESITVGADPNEERQMGPTDRAFRTGEIQTTLDVHSDPRYEQWRDAAAEYGFQSAAAVPIRHQGTISGVLNVYADRADAFRGEERIVIDHLGEILGHAIVAAQRKQALMSDSAVELEVAVPDIFDWEGPLADATIRIERAVPVSGDEFLLYGTTTENVVEEMYDLSKTRQNWRGLTEISETPDGVRFELHVTERPMLSVVASVGGSVEEAIVEQGDYRVTVHLPQGTDVQGVLEAIQAAYPEADALARRQVTRSNDPARRLTRAWMDDLTDRQRTALEAAYFSGVFEWPRDSSGEEVADSLGVSSPTFHQHVRAAERKIFGALLEDSSFEE